MRETWAANALFYVVYPSWILDILFIKLSLKVLKLDTVKLFLASFSVTVKNGPLSVSVSTGRIIVELRDVPIVFEVSAT